VAVFLAVVPASGLNLPVNPGSCSAPCSLRGAGDPQFGADLGFYVFTLPFLRFIFEWTFAASSLSSSDGGGHYLNGGIRARAHSSGYPQVKAHLSVILGAWPS